MVDSKGQGMGGMPGGMGGMPGMGGMGGMGGGMGDLFTQLLMNNPELMQDPEVLQAINDPSLKQKMA